MMRLSSPTVTENTPSSKPTCSSSFSFSAGSADPSGWTDRTLLHPTTPITMSSNSPAPCWHLIIPSFNPVVYRSATTHLAVISTPQGAPHAPHRSRFDCSSLPRLLLQPLLQNLGKARLGKTRHPRRSRQGRPR